MNRRERALLASFRALSEAEQASVVEFAEFLKSKSVSTEGADVQPEAIPRPESETVLAAIKRLSATYPMLDRARLLDQSAMLMNQHILQGREERDVIDELEGIFQTEFTQYTDHKK